MNRALRLALAAAATLAASCARPAPAPSASDDDPRFACRVDVAPLRAALVAAGGDPSRVVHPSALGGLVVCESGRRYKFVLDGRRRFAVAPMPADAPHNEYVHPVLGDGAPVRSAGGIRVYHREGRVERVVLDGESRAYCTTTESLRPAVRALVAMGLAPEAITVEGRPLACVESGAKKRYGELMPSIGRRHEMLGRAVAAGRWELAAYAVHELAEDVEELPEALAPDGTPVDLAPLARAFDEAHLRPLEAAMEAHDPERVRAAYATASIGCNDCHRVAGRAYLVVPEAPGEPVPTIAPDDAGAAADAAPRQ